MAIQPNQSVTRIWQSGLRDFLRWLFDTFNTGIIYGEVAVNPPSIAAGAITNVDVAVAGLVAGDLVFVQVPAAIEAGLVPVSATVPTTGTLRIRIFNPTAAAVDGASLTWTWLRVNMTRPQRA